MAYLTIFTAPKPFTNPHINVIQRNAIQSWLHLEDVAVMLIGDEPGIGEAAREFGVKHVPQVERDDKGVPTVRSVMAQGHNFTDSPLLCYANADMILMSDLVQATRQVAGQRKDFLMVGQRWDLDIPEPFDFSGDWEGRLRAEVEKRGEFYTPWGIDYFVFPRHLYTEVPNFTIGRPAWDNWMVFHAVTTWGAAIDATRSVTVVHQTHDYSHLPGGRPPYGSEVAKRNLALAGGRKCVYNVLDTNLELIRGRVRTPKFLLARAGFHSVWKNAAPPGRETEEIAAMRLGQNPAKDRLPAYRPPRLGVALVTYIPSPAGYFEHALEILKYQVASLHHTTGIDFDLLVFDNGSCAEIQAELQKLQSAGWIDFLVASRHNLGKIGALNWVLAAMPNELVCYADSDVLFRAGWWENSLKILETFPNPGMVSAQPCLDDVLRGSGKADRILDGSPRFRVESRLLDPGVIEEYALGVGMDPERAEKLKKAESRVVTDGQTGLQAVLGATHMQFIIPRAVAQKVVPLPVTYGLGRQEDHSFDLQVDRAGALHLSTLEAHVWHMGNLPDEKTLAEVRSMGLAEMLAMPPRLKSPAGKSWPIRACRRLARLRLLRGLVYRMYSFLFDVYAG